MKGGISIYPNYGISNEEYKEYMEISSKKGIDLIFTSLHIPEAQEGLMEKFDEILKFAKELKMKVIADVSKTYYENLDFKKYGDLLYGLRLDFGFSDDEILDICKNKNQKVFLNASTINPDWFYKLIGKGLNASKVGIFHNFYPKKYTGLDREFYKNQNMFYKNLGFETIAFVKSNYKARGPLFEGLCTIEEHRNLELKEQINELIFLKTDFILFGDSMASVEELNSLASFSDGAIQLDVELFSPVANETRLMFEGVIHNFRTDISPFVMRSQESKVINKYFVIEPKNNKEIKNKYITVDNSGYGRYKGEMSVWLVGSPMDKRVNVIGNILEEGWLYESENMKYIEKVKFLIKK